MQYLALIHIYERGTAFGSAYGLDHMWSLCTEVAFYAVLPVLAAGLVWLRDRTLLPLAIAALVAIADANGGLPALAAALA